MSDSLNNKELVAVGHELAKALSTDTPIIDIAKILMRLAERLDCTTAALREKWKQYDALAAENGQMLRLLTDISENHEEYVNQDEYLYAGVPMDYVSEINAYVSRDVEAENPFKETDAYLAEVRASAIPADVMAAIQKVARIRLDLNDFDGDKRGIVDCLGEAEESLIEVVNKFAAQLRKGGEV